VKVTDLFPSHFIKSFDLDGDTHLTIKGVQLEEHGFGKKIKSACVYFHETEKCLGLNKTNATSIAKLHGNDTDAWPGKRITLFPTTVTNNGQFKGSPCIRIQDRAPSQANTGTAQHKNAAPPPTSTPDTLPENLRKRLHAVGSQCYGSEWDVKRPQLVSHKTKGRTQTSNELTPDEALYLIAGMEKKIAQAGPAGESGPVGDPGAPGGSAQPDDPGPVGVNVSDIVARLEAATIIEDVRTLEREWAPHANTLTQEDQNLLMDAALAAEERVIEGGKEVQA